MAGPDIEHNLSRFNEREAGAQLLAGREVGGEGVLDRGEAGRGGSSDFDHAQTVAF
jgi:hypothetical protein